MGFFDDLWGGVKKGIGFVGDLNKNFIKPGLKYAGPLADLIGTINPNLGKSLHQGIGLVGNASDIIDDPTNLQNYMKLGADAGEMYDGVPGQGRGFTKDDWQMPDENFIPALSNATDVARQVLKRRKLNNGSAQDIAPPGENINDLY